MAESVVVRTKRDGQILYSDAGAIHTYTVAYEPGDFAYDVPSYAVNVFLDRGVLADADGYPSLRKGDEGPMTLSHTAYMRDLGDTAAPSTYATLSDLVHPYAGGYVASNWISTMSGRSDVFTVTATLTIDGSAFGEADKSLVFAFTSLRGGGKDGDPNTVSVSGTSYSVLPTLV
jgi:hypothetical protein